MNHLCSSGGVADHRFQDAPFADERNRYLSDCAAYGARPAVLKIKRNELLWIARRLGPDVDRGIGMTELMPIALERQNLHGATTAARRIIDIGRPWLRFLGWWREPAVAFLDQGQVDRYVTWMRDERGFTPATVERWGLTARRFLQWRAETGRQLGDLTVGDIDNYIAARETAAGRASRQPTWSRHCVRSCVTPPKRDGVRTDWQSRFLGLGSISRNRCHMPRLGQPSGKCWPTSTRANHGISAIAPSFYCSRSTVCGAVKLLLCGSIRSIGRGEPSGSFG